MNISGYSAFSAENAYKTNTKVQASKVAATFVADTKKAEKSPGPANSAQPALNSSTANTLWQTQNIAQSSKKEVTDVEESEPVIAKQKTAAEAFLEFMDKTPEQLMREEILKQLGYTEEDLAAMDPKERAKIETKVKELIEIKVEQAMREDGIDIDGVNKAGLKNMTQSVMQVT